MDNEQIARTLTDHGVNPTAVRILIYRHVDRMAHAFALADLQDALPSVDKYTAFRTLQLFADHHLLHVVEDGSGSTKYCVCHNSHPCALSEMHIHFRCERCNTTYCLPHTAIPQVSLPEGFVSRRAHFVLTGLCPSCS